MKISIDFEGVDQILSLYIIMDDHATIVWWIMDGGGLTWRAEIEKST